MKYNEEYIEGLLFEKIAGTISEGDNIIAEKAILMNPEVKILWDQLTLKMNAPKAAGFLSGLNQNNAWELVEPQLDDKPNHFSYGNKWKWMSVAAVLLLAVPLAWYFITQRSPVGRDTAASIAKGVYLKTDAGEEVSMSALHTVKVTGANFITKQNELSYVAAENGSGRWATLVVPVMKDYKIKLPDGTTVWMNSASNLRFPFRFDDKVREVFLTGEAYFEVAKDKDRKFIVHTDYADIQVHGTSFNINAYDAKNFATSLVEGAVSATKGKTLIQLKPGQEVVNDHHDLNVRSFDSQEVLSWRNGLYYFHNRSLEEISSVLSRWFNVKIAWASSGLSEQTFTGEIDKSLPLDVIISNLQLSSGIKADLKDGMLTFR